ncbi:MAG: hypothetical protein II694_08270 [Lachnospiraceae bacterium]|nr:hypothetical protein [Lachnospiraceae bacterium]
MIKDFLLSRLGTIIFFIIVAVLFLVGSSRIKKARQNAITYSNEYEAPEADADLQADGEYVPIANNGQLELLYSDVKGAIQIRDLKSGKLYKSIVDEEVYPTLKKSNKQWKAHMQSAITIKYNDLKKRDSGVKEASAGKDCGSLTSEYIENGVRVTYGFLAPGIYITVEYTIEGDELVVRVPYDKIEEKSKFAVTTIAVLPYLGACGNENEGYLFYPDGSGAVTSFERVGERSANAKMAIYYTYSNKAVSLNNLFFNYERYTAALPVFGIKKGDSAVFGYATEGESNTGIGVYPSGVVLDLNRAGFEVYVRNVYNVDMYSISSGDGNTATGGIVQRVDKQLIPEDKVIRYAFLDKEAANYSGMADVYRNYLISAGQLNKADKVDNTALALQLLMGTTKEGIVFDEYVTMTTFDQAVEILDALKMQGITDTELILTGWQKDYNEYEYWGPDRHLGGKSGLKDISEYAAANPGIRVFIESDLVAASSETNGLDREKEVAYNGLNTEIAMKDFDGTFRYLRNPAAIRNTNTKMLGKYDRYPGLGIGYFDIGYFAYPDFNEWHPYTKTETVEELKNTLKDTEAAGKSIAVKGQNQYVFGSADYIYGISDANFGLAITDYAVPFVQMVISGLIPYSSGNAGNLSYDLQTQKLQWIEFGSMPMFYLTYESALKLRDTDADTLFSSTWSDWKPVLTDTYREFKENFGALAGKRMTAHTVLSEKSRKIEYEDGTAIYLNYSDKDETFEGITIPAKDYVVIGGGR